MKFSKIFMCCALAISFNTFASDLDCKHNTLHFATSVEKKEYVKNLLDREVFDLKELNKQCQTAPHIAVELGNLELLDMFYDYLGNLNIENGKGENLLQSSFVHHQPSVTMYLISKGEDPTKKASNGLSAEDYQDKYGNNLTSKILENYKNQQTEEVFEENQKNNDSILNDLKNKIAVKEKALKELQKSLEKGDANDEDKLRIGELLAEIADLKKYIFDLENIISEQALELKKYRMNNQNNTDKLFEIAKKNSAKKEHLTTHIPEGKRIDVVTDDDLRMSDIDDLEMIDVSNDGSVVNDSMKMFELLSKPIVEVKKKD